MVAVMAVDEDLPGADYAVEGMIACALRPTGSYTN
jgi:hypothetical protein